MKSVSKSRENTSTVRSDAFRNVTAPEIMSENGRMGPTSTREGSNFNLAAIPLPVKAIVEVTGELATFNGNRNEQGRSSTGANSTATFTFSEGLRTPERGVKREPVRVPRFPERSLEIPVRGHWTDIMQLDVGRAPTARPDVAEF